MKLVDILARELTEWLGNWQLCGQTFDGQIYFENRTTSPCFERGAFSTKADDWKTAVVSKEEWQSARAAYLASIQPARDPEIASVVEKPANPWRRNRGRKTPPVAYGVMVDYKLRGDMACDYYSDFAEELTWRIDGHSGDIMQWRYAEPKHEQEKPMAQTIEQEVESAEAAASKAFDPIALRDEYKRITAEGSELSQKMAKLTDRMEEIEAALRAEGFAMVETEKHNAD